MVAKPLIPARRSVRVLIFLDAGTSRELSRWLTQEGLDAEVAGTLDEAVEALHEHVFDIVLAGTQPASLDGDPFAAATTLKLQASPTPTGLLVETDGDADLASARGFEFVISRAAGAERLLEAIASALHRQLPPERPEAVLIKRYFSALTHQDWVGLGELCTDDVVYHLPVAGPYGRIVTGRAALRAYAREVFSSFPDAAFEDVTSYELGHGFVARYVGSWRAEPDGLRRQTGAVAFRIAQGRIARIGVEVDAGRLAAVSVEQPKEKSALSSLLRTRLDELAVQNRLTAREREVLDLLVLGRNTSEIGVALGTTPRTAKFHMANLLRKLGADSRADLLRILM